MNQVNEFDPTNVQDQNYDPVAHAQAVEAQQQAEADAAKQAAEAEAAAQAEAQAQADAAAGAETTPDVEPAVVETAAPVEIPGVVERNIGGVSLSAEAQAVKEKLAKEAKMPMFIPLDPGEKPGAYRSVSINGYRCEVKKGKMISLPMSIAKLLMESYQIEAEVLNDNSRNLNNASPEKLRALGMA